MSKDRSISGGTATTTGGFQAGRGASANRLPTAPRERKPALAALAVLLILAGALSTMLLVTRSGNRVDVVMMKSTLSVGQKIDVKKDIADVSVAADNSIPYVKWEQRGQLDGLTTNNTLVAGALLIPAMLGQSNTGSAPAGTTVVGVQVKASHYPFHYLATGDKVNVLGAVGVTAGGTTTTATAPIGTATIVYLGLGDTLDITLAAPPDIAEKIAMAGDTIILTKTIAG